MHVEGLLEPDRELEAGSRLLDQAAQLPEDRLLLARPRPERGGVDHVLPLGEYPQPEPAHQAARALLRGRGIPAPRNEHVRHREARVERQVRRVTPGPNRLGPDLARDVDQQAAAVALAVEVPGPMKHLLEGDEGGLDRLVRGARILGDPCVEGAGIAILDGGWGPARPVGARRVVAGHLLLGSAASPSGRATGGRGTSYGRSPVGGSSSRGGRWVACRGRACARCRRARGADDQGSSRGPDQNASPTVTVRAVSAWWRSEYGSPSS